MSKEDSRESWLTDMNSTGVNSDPDIRTIDVTPTGDSPGKKPEGSLMSRRGVFGRAVLGVAALLASREVGDFQRSQADHQKITKNFDTGYQEGAKDGERSGRALGLSEGTERAYNAFLMADAISGALGERGEAQIRVLNGKLTIYDEMDGVSGQIDYPLVLAQGEDTGPTDISRFNNWWVGHQVSDGKGGVRIMPIPVQADRMRIELTRSGEPTMAAAIILKPHGGGPGVNPALAQIPTLEYPDPAHLVYIRS